MAISGRDPYPRRDLDGEKYRSCELCGGDYTYYELQYDALVSAATVGETVTGGSSGDTGVVVAAATESATEGTLELSGVTGGADYLAFTDNEALTGSSGFAATANHQAILKQYGKLYGEGDLVERDGKYYCKFHYHLKYDYKDKRDDPSMISEEDDD